MALSDYELQVLHQLEVQLRRPKQSLVARARTLLHAYESALAVGALAALMLAAVFIVGVALAPVAGLMCGIAGFEAARARQRMSRREDQPGPL